MNNKTSEAYRFLNEYAKNNGFYFNVIGSNKKFDTIDDSLVKELYDVNMKKMSERFEEKIHGNPDSYGITYHDDSDYDREYGYGSYGEYDDEEIGEHAWEMAGDEIDAVIQDLTDMYEEYIKTGKDEDYFTWMANLDTSDTHTDQVIIGMNPDYDEVGICMVKKQVNESKKPGVKHYSKKQIREAIAYWEKQLKQMD